MHKFNVEPRPGLDRRVMFRKALEKDTHTIPTEAALSPHPVLNRVELGQYDMAKVGKVESARCPYQDSEDDTYLLYLLSVWKEERHKEGWASHTGQRSDENI